MTLELQMKRVAVLAILLFIPLAHPAPSRRHVERSISDDENNAANPGDEPPVKKTRTNDEQADQNQRAEEENDPAAFTGPKCFFAVPRSFTSEKHKRLSASKIKTECSTGTLRRQASIVIYLHTSTAWHHSPRNLLTICMEQAMRLI